MKAGILMIAASLLATMAAHAQEPTPLPEIKVTKPPAAELPPSSVLGTPASPSTPGAPGDGAAQGKCDTTKPGGDKSLGCINEMMKRKVDQTNPVMNTPPIDARSGDLKTGVVNIPGVQQQYGKNFGNSIYPYRPPPVVYGSPIAPHR